MARLDVRVGKTVLKNPLIAGSAEHLIDADGVRRALRAGVGAVVVKSINETERGRDQLQRAEYMLFDDEWREMPWSADAPATAFMATRSGLTPQTFEAWLEQTRNAGDGRLRHRQRYRCRSRHRHRHGEAGRASRRA